jgi:hypothetical protein
MVLTWNPDSDQTHVSVNINETIAANVDTHQSLFSSSKNSLRPSMGNTNGIPFTQTAPLVFPGLDSLDLDPSHEAKTVKEKIKHTANFCGDYFDRRAQAKYVCLLSHSVTLHIHSLREKLTQFHFRLQNIRTASSSKVLNLHSPHATQIPQVELLMVICSRSSLLGG